MSHGGWLADSPWLVVCVWQDELQAVKLSAVSSGGDWRLALGEVSLNLRRELADRPAR